jgi:hypothetical protein
VPSLKRTVTGESPFQRLSDRSDRIVHTGIPPLDTLMGGLNSSAITLIDSGHPFAFEVLSMLCVNAIKRYGGTVVYVDGGISIDPYHIASLSKRSGLRPDAALSKIMVARAFTAYQLDSIIADRLEAVIDEYDPVLLIIACITDLLMDRTVREQEAITILRRSLALIGKTTLEHNLITVVTKRPRLPSSRAHALNEMLYKGASEILEFKRKKKGIELHMSSCGLTMDYLPLSIYQTTLDEFIGGARHG